MTFIIEEPGEYKTRDGRKAVVFGIAPCGEHSIAGYIVGESEGVETWRPDGSYSVLKGRERVTDIIGLWEVKERWVEEISQLTSHALSVPDIALIGFIQSHFDTLAARVEKLEQKGAKNV